MKYFLITVITIMTLVGCGGAEERKEVYLEKAKLSLEAGDLDKARIEIKNVLQIDPKDAKAYFQLGEIFDQKKDYQKAFSNYSKALELAPENLEYHAKIGTYYLLLAENIEAAIEKRDLILGKENANISGLLLNAGILYKQNNVDAAMKISHDIYLRQPEHVLNALFLSSLYLNNKNYDDAISVLNASIKKNTGNYALINSLANTYFKAEKYDLAENEYKKLIEKKPEVFLNYMKLASFYKSIEKFDKAESVLRKAMVNNIDDVDRVNVLMEFIQQTKGNQVAIDELNNLIKSNNNIGDLRLMLAKLYTAQNNLEEAEKVLERAALDFSENAVGIKARIYLSSLYMKKQNLDAAINVIDDAIQISPNDPDVNFVNAKLQLIKNNYEGAIISLRTVVNGDPENIEAYFLLSSVQKRNGEQIQAGETLNRAYENNRTNKKGLILLAQYHAKIKNIEDAEKVVDTLLVIDDKDYDSLSIKNAILILKKEYAESKLYSEKLIKLYPEKPNGYLQKVSLLVLENRHEQALSLLKQGYVSAGKDMKILKILTSLQLSMKGFAEAEERIKQEIIEKGETLELYMLLSDVYNAAGKMTESEDILRKIIALNPSATDAYLILSNMLIKSSKNALAKKLLKEGVSRNINDFKLSLVLANLYSSDDEYEMAINEYERILETNPGNVIVSNNLALMLAENRTDSESLARAKELASMLKNIDQAVILDTAGWVYYIVENYSEAVNVLKIAVEKSPDVAVYNYHLGAALYKLGDESSAKIHLTKSLAGKNNFRGKDDAEVLLQKLQ